jgi:hypothetical protein
MRLGDSHNFGKHVLLDEASGVVVKPRPLLWEWLLLSAASPLRHLVAQLADDADAVDPFAAFPDLAFSFDADFGGPGRVQFHAPSPLPPPPLTPRDAQTLGAAVAGLAWLGVHDLHHRNVRVGHDRDGRLCLAPLDVEAVLASLSLPTQTLLVPLSPAAARTSGLAPVLAASLDLTLVAAASAAYLETLALFSRHEQALTAAICTVPRARDCHVRVIVRDTAHYVAMLREPHTRPADLTDAEAVQLDRGDVPYFFRTIDDAAIRYVTTVDGATTTAALPPTLLRDRGLLWTDAAAAGHRRRTLATLATAGCLQWARALAGEAVGDARFGVTTVAATDATLTLASPQLASPIGCRRHPTPKVTSA